MEKFIKLLDPWKSVPFGPGLTIAEQAIRARQAFPEMVARSNLAYWRLGDAIQHSGTRFLLGLAVSFSLSDLYLADLLNVALGKRAAEMPRVDVFDRSEEAATSEDLKEYSPGRAVRHLGWHA